jgi:hypothetical protein
VQLSINKPGQALRDLSAIVDTIAKSGLPCCKPVKLLQVKAPIVVEIFPELFHYKGLLPLTQRIAWFITTNDFSNTRWCKRKLKGFEMLKAVDDA